MTSSTRLRLRVSRKALTALASVATLTAVLTASAPGVIRIHSGDTLSAIANARHTTVARLIALNHLDGNGRIYAGELLRIPAAAAPKQHLQTRTYVVRHGDTLSGVAKRLHTRSAALKKRNHLRRSTLHVGQHLQYEVVVGAAHRTTRTVTTNNGYRIPATVQHSANAHRSALSHRHQPSKATVRAMIKSAARRHHLDPAFALAVAYHESGFQQRVVSPVDAIGVMQVLPSTGRGLSAAYGRRFDLLKPADNIEAGVLLLAQLQRATGSQGGALAGYYQGLGSVHSRGLLPQTRAYVSSVLALVHRFR